MTGEEYGKWANKHSATFGFGADGDPAMFLAWMEHFDARQVTITELNAATAAAAKLEKPLIGRAAHLAFINDCITAGRRRVEAKRKVAEAYQGPSRCLDCLESGLMTVPHLRGFDSGSWDGMEFVIACHCFAGKKAEESGSLPPMKFDDYMAKNPNFRAQLRKRAEDQEAYYSAHGSSRGQDDTTGAAPLRKSIQNILNRIKEMRAAGH